MLFALCASASAILKFFVKLLKEGEKKKSCYQEQQLTNA